MNSQFQWFSYNFFLWSDLFVDSVSEIDFIRVAVSERTICFQYLTDCLFRSAVYSKHKTENLFSALLYWDFSLGKLWKCTHNTVHCGGDDFRSVSLCMTKHKPIASHSQPQPYSSRFTSDFALVLWRTAIFVYFAMLVMRHHCSAWKVGKHRMRWEIKN